MKRAALVIVAAILVLLLASFVVMRSMMRGGFSALDEPSAMEAAMARMMRGSSVPPDLVDRTNPLPLTPAILAEGRAHFADHCAGCHGNDGKGKTFIGQRVYPRVPDMTQRSTQAQSDGALFATIENGVRLTAMPAFGEGTAESAYGSWTLVHFIRHLPKLTREEIAGMERLNPKTPAEWARSQARPGAAPLQPVAPDAAAHDATPHHH